VRRWFLPATVVVAVLVSTGHARAAPGLAFGFSDDAPKWYGARAVTPGRILGARRVRLTLQWAPGQRTLDATQWAELAQGARSAAAQGLRVVLAVYAEPGSGAAPRDAKARGDYCTFVRSAIARHQSLRDVVIWNEPNSAFFWRPQFSADGVSAAPAAYEALLARCYDVLHAAAPSINVVAPATAPRGDDRDSHSPDSFLRGIGDAYRRSGRTRPLFDTVAHHVYGDTFGERPWQQHPDSKTIAEGDWNKLMWNLARAFAGTAQPIPGECAGRRCVSIWYLESGFQTQTPAAARYTGREISTGTIPASVGGEPGARSTPTGAAAPDQATQIGDALRLAYCQPFVTAYHNFLLFDERRLEGWQSAPLFADGTGKPSLFAFLDAVGEVNAGLVDCDALKGGRPSGDFRPPHGSEFRLGRGRGCAARRPTPLRARRG